MPPFRQICLILALGLPGTAHADSPLAGVRLDIMPVGCRVHVSYSNGDRIVREFVGKSANTYRVKTYKGAAGTELAMTSTVNAQGFGIRNDMADGKWETYTPFSCLLKPGDCNFTLTNSEGKIRIFKGVVVQDGRKITTKGGFVGEKSIPTFHATLDQFNMVARSSNGQISFQITQYEGCDKPPSGAP